MDANNSSSEDVQEPTSQRRSTTIPRASTAPRNNTSTRPEVGTMEPWTVEQFMDPNFRPIGLPAAIVDMARSQITFWNRREPSWAKRPKWRCAANSIRRKNTEWLNGEAEYACDFCERNGRLCIAVQDGEIKVLPLGREGREDISRVDVGLWVETNT